MHDTSHYIIGAELPWVYRVVRNPRFGWLLAAAMFLVLGSLMAVDYFEDPEGEPLETLFTAVGMLGLAAASPVVGHFTNLRTPTPLTGPVKQIPSAGLWTLHVPFVVVLLGFGSYSARVLNDPTVELSRRGWLTLLFCTVVCFGLLILAVVFAAHRRSLLFTPEGLEYRRGRFRADIPWTAITGLRTVADVNHERGGLLPPDHPNSRRIVRPGVQLFVRDGVDKRGVSLQFRINGQDVIGVECIAYKVDPNTLINAIYLMVERPELRPLLALPEGAEIFAGPSWNTRRTMRVNDRWDRRTDQIIRATEIQDA